MDKKREHIKEMFPRISDIEDPEIREKVVSVWLEAWTGSDFDRIEDAGQWEPIKETLTISNVEHTNQVVECGIAMAEVVEREQGVKINKDTLIAAAILHDVDKLLIFHEASGTTTQMGSKLAHTAIGSHLALKAGLPLEIAHAIGSHSSNYSTISPRTPEAVILYHADHALTQMWAISRNIDLSFVMKKGSE